MKKLIPLRRIDGAVQEMSDDALLAACTTSERVALGALFDRYYSNVRSFLARMSGTDDRDLDDLVQLTFENVYRSAKRFDGRSSVKTWILGVAKNVARHHVRSEIRRKRTVEAAVATTRLLSVDTLSQDSRKRKIAELHNVLGELKPKLREAFVLVYVEGLSGVEAAQVCGVREGTLWKRLHQARKEIRSRLGESSQ